MNVRKGFSLDLKDLSARINAVRIEGPEGGVGFKGWEFDDYILALSAAWGFSKAIPEAEYLTLAREAIHNAAKEHGPVTSDRLESALGQAVGAYLNTTSTPFVLATSLNLPWSTRLKNLRLDGATVTFAPRFPKSVDRSLLSNPLHANHVRDDSELLKARMRVEARSPLDAYDKAMATLDFIRGAWNFSMRKKTWRSFGSGDYKPLNTVLPGPVHTLHRPDGRLAVELYGYELIDHGAKPSRLSSKKLAEMAAYLKRVRRVVATSAYGADLRKGLIRYCRALDSRDTHHAFVKLWGVLEFLTSTTRMTYEHTIRRAAFLFEDTTPHEYVLQALREQRNRSVHAGVDNVRPDDLVRLHAYAARVMLFLLQMSRYFGSLEEAGGFLALPIDPSLLTRRSELLKRALRFRQIA